MSIKCIVVDDHTLFREGLRRLLDSEADIKVIGEACDAVGALELLKRAIGATRPELAPPAAVQEREEAQSSA